MKMLLHVAIIAAYLPAALCFTSTPPSNRISVGNTVGLTGSGDASSTPLIPTLDDESSNIEQTWLPPSPVGVIFDMDGTLIKHSINFAEMRRRIYEVVDSDPIGKNLEKDCVLAMPQLLTEEGQRRCNEIFVDIEQRAIDDMELQDGGAELLQFLGKSSLKRAVLTRNMERNVQHMKEMYKNEMSINNENDDDTIFDDIVARNTKASPDDDEPIKSKPSPDGIIHICKLWNCDPNEVIFVGDSANDDIAAANRAGCGGAVLLQQGGCQLDTDSGYAVGDSELEIMERTPTLCVESLSELRYCIGAVLDEQDKIRAAQSKLSSGDGYVVYSTENKKYSVQVPSISVKSV